MRRQEVPQPIGRGAVWVERGGREREGSGRRGISDGLGPSLPALGLSETRHFIRELAGVASAGLFISSTARRTCNDYGYDFQGLVGPRPGELELVCAYFFDARRIGLFL